MNPLKSIDNFVMSVDDKVLELHTKGAEFYQDLTGWNAKKLPAYLLGLAAGYWYSRASIMSTPEDPSPMTGGTLGALTYSLMGLSKHIESEYRMQLTENVPEERKENPFYRMMSYVRTSSMAFGVTHLVAGATQFVIGFRNGDGVSVQEGMANVLRGVTNMSFSSALYLEDSNVEPPSGRPIIARIGDTIKGYLAGPSPIPEGS